MMQTTHHTKILSRQCFRPFQKSKTQFPNWKEKLTMNLNIFLTKEEDQLRLLQDFTTEVNLNSRSVSSSKEGFKTSTTNNKRIQTAIIQTPKHNGILPISPKPSPSDTVLSTEQRRHIASETLELSREIDRTAVWRPMHYHNYRKV